MIIGALSLAELQKYAWLMTQLETDGIRSLSEGRRRIEEELRINHRLRQRVDTQKSGRSNRSDLDLICPKCGARMYRYTYRDSDSYGAELVTIDRCDGGGDTKSGGCRYSYIVGDE